MKPEAMEELKGIIFTRITAVLRDAYQEQVDDVNRDSLHARLAFKGDPYLNELRLALERMDRGEYGCCILCKKEIDLPILRQAPTSHFCHTCSDTVHKRVHTHLPGIRPQFHP